MLKRSLEHMALFTYFMKLWQPYYGNCHQTALHCLSILVQKHSGKQGTFAHASTPLQYNKYII